jgi:hypothetical protein
MMFREVREPITGRLLFRFDPERDLIEYQERNMRVIIDLTQYRDNNVDNDPESVIISTY